MKNINISSKYVDFKYNSGDIDTIKKIEFCNCLDNTMIFSAFFDDECPLNWINENEASILNDEFPISDLDSSSIFDKVYEFYNSSLSDSEVYLNSMFNYRKSHSLIFAFRGQQVPDIYLAKNKDGSYKLSGKNLEININIVLFLEEFKKNLAFCTEHKRDTHPSNLKK